MTSSRSRALIPESELHSLMRWADRYAGWLAARTGSPMLRDELHSAALAGLSEATHRYDGARGVPFSVYARQRMVGAVRDELRRMDPLSRRDRAWWARVGGDAPGEVPGDEDTTRGDAEQRRRAEIARRLSQWRARRDCVDQAADHATENPEQACIRRELVEVVRRALGRLGPRDQQVLRALYYEGATTVAVAHRLGVTQGRASQLRKECLRRLARELESSGITA